MWFPTRYRSQFLLDVSHDAFMALTRSKTTVSEQDKNRGKSMFLIAEGASRPRPGAPWGNNRRLGYLPIWLRQGETTV
jgi:hypothetical protein